MINKKENFAAWALLLTELDEAREHLDSLVKEMNQSGVIEDEEFEVYLGHVYAHLNRVWNSRNQNGEITKEQWEEFSSFPKDIYPVG